MDLKALVLSSECETWGKPSRKEEMRRFDDDDPAEDYIIAEDNLPQCGAKVLDGRERPFRTTI